MELIQRYFSKQENEILITKYGSNLLILVLAVKALLLTGQKIELGCSQEVIIKGRQVLSRLNVK